MPLPVQLERTLASVPFLATLGVRVEQARPGEVVLGLPHRRDLSNHTGVLHSGVVFALGELAATVAVGSHPRLAPLTQRVKASQIRYQNPPHGGLTAQATVAPAPLEAVLDALDRTGRALLEVPVQIRDAEGAEVADVLVGLALHA